MRADYATSVQSQTEDTAGRSMLISTSGVSAMNQ
jgi:hypothetical protein